MCHVFSGCEGFVDEDPEDVGHGVPGQCVGECFGAVVVGLVEPQGGVAPLFYHTVECDTVTRADLLGCSRGCCSATGG